MRGEGGSLIDWWLVYASYVVGRLWVTLWFGGAAYVGTSGGLVLV